MLSRVAAPASTVIQLPFLLEPLGGQRDEAPLSTLSPFSQTSTLLDCFRPTLDFLARSSARRPFPALIFLAPPAPASITLGRPPFFWPSASSFSLPLALVNSQGPPFRALLSPLISSRSGFAPHASSPRGSSLHPPPSSTHGVWL